MKTADIQMNEMEQAAKRRDAVAHLPECPQCHGVGALKTGEDRYGVIIETCPDCDGLGRRRPGHA